MFVEHVAEIEVVLEAEIPEALVLGAEVVDEAPGAGLAAGEEQFPVEGVVGVHEAVNVPSGDGLLLGLQERLHGGQCFFVGRGGNKKGENGAFNAISGKPDFLDLFHVHEGYVGASLGADLKEPFPLELDEGFPDRGLADVHPPGDVLLAEPSPGKEAPVEDVPSQGQVHLPRDSVLEFAHVEKGEHWQRPFRGRFPPENARN
ncbi:hypothetical protein SDC9_72155 [bioreactor metagenome]|uniref:Uncharacterized protein n=1 Tax=bioreactor metagenome TaxID=1076179 RepID=A0A644YBV0_9ZZZZ